jgi:putative peptide zinc metalloprotease protein
VRRTSLLRSKRIDEERGALAETLERLSWRWTEGADAAFGRLAAQVGLLWRRSLLPLHGLVVGTGLLVYATQRLDGGLAAPRSLLVWLVCVALWVPALAVTHELGHGLACKAAGRRVKGVGFTFLDDIAPSVYVDISDMWMADRAARIGATLGGPATNLVLAAVFAVLAWATEHDGASFALTCAADASLFLVAYTLWPFHLVKEDGYEALTDLVRVPALRGRAWKMLTGWARELPPDPGLTPRLRSLFLIFSVGQALTACAVVFAVTWLVVTALKPGSPLF